MGLAAAALLTGIICLFLSFLVVFLLGGTRAFIGTPLNTCYKLLMCQSSEDSSTQRRGKRTVGKAQSKQDNSCMNRFMNYLMNEKNPIIQIFYVLLAAGLILGWFICVLPRVPNLYTSFFESFICFSFIVGAVGSYIITCKKDPGWITKHNIDKIFQCFPYDNILYSEKKICPVCKIERPPRSKHCSLCGRCVSKMDHHCPWFNICIGEYNFRYFLLFLFLNGMASAYISVTSLSVIRDFMKRARLLEPARTLKINGQPHPVTKTMLLQILILEFPGCCLLFVYAALIALLVFGFLAMQLTSFFKNETTGEEAKWDSIKKRRKATQLLLKMDDQCRKEKADKKGNNRSDNQQKMKSKSKDSDEQEVFKPLTESERKEIEADLSVKLENKYSKGLIQNAMEVISPLSLRESPPVFDEHSKLWWGKAKADNEKEEKKQPKSSTSSSASSRLAWGKAHLPLPAGFLNRPLFNAALQRRNKMKEEEEKRKEMKENVQKTRNASKKRVVEFSRGRI
ncbi:putative DHHC-type zinc finger family protein [Monocercomonoides exilis]|uniref:putative DHHC-type zinc finger family protein n=1 Tax=Monocercomonoides exilis TaxID=2049356 RepID=UPI0035595071|nr:putative DHHC-type zinc finger family protein [Monocercomonoides exilis]|eukprot:MONOS_8587.1-p1 / transcript=MONOS_8587.1 / gene=MONOS_8587 / organism=Monocercomonoides_exilis_PA203 / gene_product=DHHC-type zinc finger family protein isoform 1 / transcript_product=DHHC-type zinc finger family protein isoform 1 / location=Mono_scaffold00327:32865-34916(+) / protein_length=510 / sequence_SO=supercontig / SO=protein_coding / is_pseudo=false